MYICSTYIFVWLQVDEFVSALVNYEKENIPEVCLKAVQPYLDDPEFDPENIRRQSFAAAGLCAWVINIVKYYEVYCEVRISPVWIFDEIVLK